ncbi:MAG: pyridoxal phosphate-dependent aminotransferase [Barnesiella sp.]|nr:pyridoxal phosphate-dependent aminotransferase [Barnesiella sp.]
MGQFDNIINRRHSGSYKWDTPASDDILPMWVADMDFMTAPCIIEALQRRVAHGVFGYTKVGKEYYDALTGWFSRRHGWAINPDHVIYTSGVVPAISAIIKGLTRPGDKVIVQTPVYNCFFSSIRNNGCEIFESPLVYHADGSYSIDFDDLERCAADPRATMLLLCNPHNPAGRVWTADELRRIGDICLRNNVIVVSDEIHCELTFSGFKYTPYATLGSGYAARCVCCNSPSKAFNTAGLQIANIVCVDEQMRARIDRAINDNEVCDVNPFGVVGLIAAYNEGEQWLAELVDYLYGNYKFAAQRFADELPGYTVTPLEGTYLLWLNIAPSGLNGEQFAAQLEEKERVMLSPGIIYGPAGEQFVRINLAAPRALVADGIDRIIRFAKSL